MAGEELTQSKLDLDTEDQKAALGTPDPGL